MIASLKDLAQRPAPWLVGEAPDRDIVLSSRVRLARNVEGRHFAHTAGESTLDELRERVLAATGRVGGLAGATVLNMEDLAELDRRFLLERHLISVDLVRNLPGRCLVVSDDEAEGIMVNEEDHLRIQTLRTGLDPLGALKGALRLAEDLEAQVPFAFDERLGYLTACPTNVGTGLRASVLLHLPGLAQTGDIERVLNSLRRLNYTVRGFYGEGSGVIGSLYQVSNSVTLGPSEDDIVQELLRHTRQVIAAERKARRYLMESEEVGLSDRVWRAHGVLSHARLLSTKEAFERLSDVRLGSGLGILPGVDESMLNMLLISVQSAHLQIVAEASLDAPARDEVRARYVRDQLAIAHTRKDER